MADLLTTATVRLVDQLTGPLHAIASRVSATTAQLGKVPGALQNAVMAPHMLGTGLLGGFLVHKEYEFDKLKTRFREAGFRRLKAYRQLQALRRALAKQQPRRPGMPG